MTPKSWIGLFCGICLVWIPTNAAELTGTITIQVQQGSEQFTKEDHGGVVIYLIGYKEPPGPNRSLSIPQQNKQFVKEILPTVKGETVAFPNRDSVYHNIFSLSKNARFDLGLYKDGASKSYKFKRIGITKIFCNIHPQMRTTVMVLPNRGFTVSDKSGKYQIMSIPDGTYTVRIWLKNAKRFRRKVSFQGDQVQTLDIPLRQILKPEKHFNKFGQPYSRF